MKIYKELYDFADKTPAVSPATRTWMDAFLCELGERMFQELGESVQWEADMRVIPGIEVSGFIPFTSGGLRLTLMAPLEADADRSHYPAIPCVREMLDSLTKDMEDDFKRVEGIPASEADSEQYWSFVDSWNESCDCYADYIFEVWQEYGRIKLQAYVSLDEERTCVKNEWFIGELPDSDTAAEELVPVIMAAWEGKI